MTAALRGFLILMLTWLMLGGMVVTAHAQDGGVLPVPTLSGHAIDQANVLTAPQRQALDDKLSAFEQERGTQLVVLIVPTTQPEDIAAYAQRVGDTWKIGRRQVGDGLLLVVALNDRRVRIEVAKALEGAVPDLAASRIIEGAIVPAFKRGDVAAGIDAGVDQLMARVRGAQAGNGPQRRLAKLAQRTFVAALVECRRWQYSAIEQATHGTNSGFHSRA